MSKVGYNVLEYGVRENFTERSFVELLLPLLCHNRVYKISEDTLCEKLYYYYKDPSFNELFKNIKAKDNKVDIKDALYIEKYFGYGIWWNADNKCLNLGYHDNLELDNLKKQLSNEGLSMMNKLVKELALMYRVEALSPNPMTIYRSDLTDIFSIGDNYLITDGKIDGLDDEVNVDSANYVILQNSRIKNLKVYTKIMELEYLKKLSDIANQDYEKAYVKSLK